METILLFLLLILNGVLLFFVFTSFRRKESDASIATRALIDVFRQEIGRTEQSIRAEMSIGRREADAIGRESREESARSLKSFGDSLERKVLALTESQHRSFESFSGKLADVIAKNDERMEKVREAVEKRLEDIRRDNGVQLEKMRATVDEKLHDTLEKRLGESFKLVSDRLELVHKGLGEMQSLATGVGDLKKVLQNVKTRGMWGEVQLENLLSDILTPEQYEKNVVTKQGSADRVEFAIKIPSKDEHIASILLPVDAKFPLEDYQGLIDASERGDIEAIDRLSKALELRVKSEAKDIHTKYIDPPYTTDFGILFLPNEGLYAEVLRRPGFADNLRRDYKVVIAGPTTITALLSSLQVGFRALAIEKRSSEVWSVLAAVKKEFVAFGDILDKTHKKLQEASNTIEKASSKSRTIERKLGKVQELPIAETIPVIEA